MPASSMQMLPLPNLSFYISIIIIVIRALNFKKAFDTFEIILGLFAIAGIIIIYNTHLQFSIGIVIGLIICLLNSIGIGAK